MKKSLVIVLPVILLVIAITTLKMHGNSKIDEVTPPSITETQIIPTEEMVRKNYRIVTDGETYRVEFLCENNWVRINSKKNSIKDCEKDINIYVEGDIRRQKDASSKWTVINIE